MIGLFKKPLSNEFNNQVEGKFKTHFWAQNKDIGAALQMLPSGVRVYICDAG